MDERMQFSFPKPGKVLIGAMVLLLAIWIMLGTGLNWAGADKGIFLLLVGSDAILDGEVWRLLTSFLIHQPSGPGSTSHVLFSIIGLYFLGATLEERWGGKRFASFLLLSGMFAALAQVLVTKLIPALHQDAYFGALGVIDAVAVAWALSFRGQQVRLFFVLPISGTGLLIFVVALNVLYLIGLDQRAEGFVTPFGGMLAGWALADGTAPRQAYLRFKLGRLASKSQKIGSKAPARARAGLRVIEGGKKLDKDMLN